MIVATYGNRVARARKPLSRSVALGASVALAIGVPTWQALAPFGLSAAEFSRQGDTTLRAASYAFSIWGLLYTALVAYVVYAAWPSRSDSALLRTVGWPSAFAIAGCGAWILASAFNWKLATVLIISCAALALTAAMIRAFKDEPYFDRGERFLVVFPLSALAGWLTIATALNVMTVLTAWGVIDTGSARYAAAACVATTTLLALGVLSRIRTLAYAAPIAWGLCAVAVAESQRQPIIAIAAGLSAVLVVIAWGVLRPRAGAHSGG